MTLVGPWFVSLTNTPKAGVKASVQKYQYYGEWKSLVAMRGGSSFDHTFGWSWNDYRKQDKTIEERHDKFTWNGADLLPMTTTISGNWDWSEDKTVNTSGVYNLAKRDYKRGSLNLTKTRLQTGNFIHTIKAMGQFEDQKSVSLNQRNDFTEGSGSLGGQTGFAVAPGVVLAGRLWGTASGGTRALGDLDSPSSANGDTVGVGVYYDRRWASGFVEVSRRNFQERYLDYRRNSNALIDTSNVPEALKIVEEKKVQDATAVDFENTFRTRGVTLTSTLSRLTKNEDYAANGKGRTENLADMAALDLSVATGRDSFVVSFEYGFSWDDQKYKNTTAFRGKQYTKKRDVSFGWFRELFAATQLGVRLHQQLSQDIAENRFNNNDKDRLDSDLNLTLDRDWNDFAAQMAFNYKQTKDLAIRESRSATNNVKDSYQVSPAYTWDVADWLALDQTYTLYILYTDYLYSELASVNNDDNYNKRGNLTSRMIVSPSDRLELVLKHVYSKTFNATQTSIDAAGNRKYFKDKIKRSSTISLGLQYDAAAGVALMAATEQQKDITDSFGKTNKREIKYRGKMAVGIKVSKGWGGGQNPPLQLSADVKKNYAFGEGVVETGRDYWDADVWLKWSF